MDEARGIILYDAVCILCSRWTRFVIVRDPQGLFKFMPIQSDKGRALAMSLGIDPGEPESFAVVMDGKACTKSAAVIAVVELLPRWGWCRVLRHAPHGMLDWLYDRIARNRYRIFGKAETCIVPDASVRARFDDLETAMARTAVAQTVRE